MIHFMRLGAGLFVLGGFYLIVYAILNLFNSFGLYAILVPIALFILYGIGYIYMDLLGW